MIQSTAIIGMGALGLLYADIIAKKMGNDNVTFIMDEERLVRNNGKVFSINGEKKTFKMSDAGKMQLVDLVIVAVKYTGLKNAIKMISKCVGPDTIILSVLNGINSEELIAEEYGKEHMIYTVAQGMDAMKFEDSLTYSQMGELRIGTPFECQKDNLEKVQELFEYVSMPYVKEEDILYRMWGKFMLNVGVNQTCMAYETTYGGVLTEGSEENRVMIGAMREVVVLANKLNIALSEEDVEYYVDILKTLRPDGVPSMRQDGIAKRLTEVEMFAGTVISLSQKNGLDAPVNRMLYDKIKMLEASF